MWTCCKFQAHVQCVQSAMENHTILTYQLEAFSDESHSPGNVGRLGLPVAALPLGSSGDLFDGGRSLGQVSRGLCGVLLGYRLG